MLLRDPQAFRQLMLDRDMSGARLGRAIKKSRQFISQLRTGERLACTDATAEAIATALAVPVDQLFVASKTRESIAA